ncbi:MAG: hypothetical protein RLZZ623_2122 [Actinomycetota bacterium]|jgi:transformation/transcription domain-associated protein
MTEQRSSTPDQAARLAALRTATSSANGGTNRRTTARRPAHSAKILSAGLSSTAVLGMVAFMGWQANVKAQDALVSVPAPVVAAPTGTPLVAVPVAAIIAPAAPVANAAGAAVMGALAAQVTPITPLAASTPLAGSSGPAPVATQGTAAAAPATTSPAPATTSPAPIVIPVAVPAPPIIAPGPAVTNATTKPSGA